MKENYRGETKIRRNSTKMKPSTLSENNLEFYENRIVIILRFEQFYYFLVVKPKYNFL